MTIAENVEPPAAHHGTEEVIEMTGGNITLTGALPTREQILSLQSMVAMINDPQPEPTHFFAPGMYLRELTVPAGMLIVGKIHKHAHFLSVLKGRAVVISEFGREIVEAGHISISPPGVKRVVLALEDTKFITVHHNPCNTTDLELIEGDHIEPENLKIMNDVFEVLP